jgi:hypothetical protein
MKKFWKWIKGPNGHALVSMVLLYGSQVFPQYAGLIQAAAGAFGYGAVVAPHPDSEGK